ncbi:protein tyrosine kinase [Ancylostoma ceylanicum]|uniref:Protein tyrosine kinase n=1 Tax=Ancylostoma ceylanicum TaxID=53326 RepID=A0A0D6LLG5_9BILA|nr:protein tyrosine kinase [Ancylostoma ceylanicum]
MISLVFCGTWHYAPGEERVVALKKVFVLEKEAQILSKIRHRNIIHFYGICKSLSDFFIVTDYAENGSLFDYLHNDKIASIDFTTTLKWAEQIAQALHYLHFEATDTIIHRDLKSKNVVIDGKLVCKICDFGTSKDLTHSCTAPTWGGTAAWMSPEIIKQNEMLTTATDVWSYGVVLWEMLSKEVPYKEFTEYRIYTLITEKGVTLAIPENCPQKLKTLMEKCWKMNPKERLNMKEILGELHNISKNSETQKECCEFLEKENWHEETIKQKEQVEKMRKNLEKRIVKLQSTEKIMQNRIRNEAIIDAQEADFVERVQAAIFRHRITGARLLEISQKDLEYLGINKLGTRIEVMRKEHGHAHIPNQVTSTASIILILGMNLRTTDNTRRFKFYVDIDYNEIEFNYHDLRPLNFLLATGIGYKAICEPAFSNNFPFVMSEYVTADENTGNVKVTANIYFEDFVVSSQPYLRGAWQRRAQDQDHVQLGSDTPLEESFSKSLVFSSSDDFDASVTLLPRRRTKTMEPLGQSGYPDTNEITSDEFSRTNMVISVRYGTTTALPPVRRDTAGTTMTSSVI